jgi:DUF4097 and DUF4098 domain-containing protein YvlB
VRASKVFLLLAILLFGGLLESAWRVREQLDVGPAGCRVLGGKFYGPSFSFESEAQLTAGASPEVVVENAFGSVTIGAGGDGRVHARLRSVVFLPTEEAARAFASRVRLLTSREGERISVGTNRSELRSSDVGLETHLVIEVPAAAAVKVENEHGGLNVGGVATARLNNAFGDVSLARVAGAAEVVARHGEVTVEGVGGELTLAHRYGDARVEDVAGAARLEAQHGELRVQRVGGVRGRLQHANLKVEAVRGDLEVTGEHAAVEARDIAGAARVQTSYRRIAVAGVSGEARLTTSHGPLSAQDVGGPLLAESSYEDVSVAGIAGPVQIKVEHGGVSARGLERGGRIACSGDDVEVDGFGGVLEIEAQRGDVRVTPRTALGSGLSVRAANGAVELEVPAGSRFELEASASDGEVHVALDDVKATTTGRGLFKGRVGAGGAAVKLAAEHGDVTLRRPENRSAERE